MLNNEKLDQLVKRHTGIEREMSANPDPETYVKLASEYASLGEVVAKIRELRDQEKALSGLEELLADKATDGDMRMLAELELPETEEKIEALNREIQLLLLPRDSADDKSAILELRAGTGGSEAALFAGALFRMYERYASSKRWKVEVLSESPGEMGGYKEIIASITGKGAFARLKFELGVHRVQRVPETEASGRIHTSAATVAVLPEAEDIDIEILDKDIRIDTMRSSGAGGQHVNTTDFGSAHHASAIGHRRDLVGKVAAPEPGKCDEDAAGAALRHGTPARRRGPGLRPKRPGRVGRPFRAHPHL